MKLQLQQDKSKKEIEVKITYAYMDERIQKMVQGIRQYEYTLMGKRESQSYEVALEDILYFDCTERSTFFYTKDGVYECDTNLSNLEKELRTTTIVRIQKNCLLNTRYLKCVSPYPNHRLLAELKNGEKLIVSRKYIPDLQNMGKRGLL